MFYLSLFSTEVACYLIQIIQLFCCCRACRTGNYIAFFRLAKKATYLQACLMHAHFAKVLVLCCLCIDVEQHFLIFILSANIFILNVQDASYGTLGYDNPRTVG